jgi:ABC-type lipoprotein release transport system permease subunit
LLIAIPARGIVASLLYGVTTGDVVSWLVAPALLIAIALIAAAVPARRAAKCDPAVTLRAE